MNSLKIVQRNEVVGNDNNKEDLIDFIKNNPFLDWRFNYQISDNKITKARELSLITNNSIDTINEKQLSKSIFKDYDFVFDNTKMFTYVNGKEISIEFRPVQDAILLYLAKKSPGITSSKELSLQLPTEGYAEESSVRQAIKRIRDSYFPELILTQKGHGYYLNPGINWLIIDYDKSM